jgi:hypothetical protein
MWRRVLNKDRVGAESTSAHALDVDVRDYMSCDVVDYVSR